MLGGSEEQRHVRVVAAVVERDGRFLVCRRPPDKRHGGLWEFPGGKCELGESDFDAVHRELREELGVETVLVGEPLFAVNDAGSVFRIVFLPVEIRGEPRALEHDAIAWAALPELAQFELAPSDARFVARLVGD